MELETIKSLAKKLAALAAADSGATNHEREIAANKLNDLLTKRGLKMSDVLSAETATLQVICLNAEDQKLLLHIAMMILDSNSLQYFIKGANSKNRFRKNFVIEIDNLAITDIADIIACHAHYKKIAAALEKKLKSQKAAINLSLKKIATAVILQNQIFAPTPEESSSQKSKNLSAAELAAIKHAMRHTNTQKWEKIGGNINSAPPPLLLSLSPL